MKKYRERWRAIVAGRLAELAADCGAAQLDARALVIETPPQPEMGDIAFPMFPFARALRKAPAAIAQEVARRISSSPEAAGGGLAEAAGPYVNVRLAPAAIIGEVLGDIESRDSSSAQVPELAGQRVVVEFSCPNTNKPRLEGPPSISRVFRPNNVTIVP